MLLLLAYWLEGFGYIVSATFIVAVINSAQGDYEPGAWAWVVVGLAGIPACVPILSPGERVICFTPQKNGPPLSALFL